MLTTEHAAEDDEVAAGQRLAARFVRRPEEETRAPSGKSVAPYIAAGAFVAARGWRSRGLFPDVGRHKRPGWHRICGRFLRRFL